MEERKEINLDNFDSNIIDKALQGNLLKYQIRSVKGCRIKSNTERE
jgi:hypothetical protein